MDPLRIIVTWDGSGVDFQVARATTADDVERVRRLDHQAQRLADVFRGWALSHGGSVIESRGVTGSVELPASALSEVSQVRAAASSAIDGTVALGIGKKLDEAVKAAKLAVLKGGDSVIFYDRNVEQALAQAQTQQEGQGLAKADEGSGGTQHVGSVPHKAPASRQHGEHSEGETAEKQAEVPHPEGAPSSDYEGEFRKLAGKQDTADRAKKARKSQDFTQLKEQVATALEGLRGQLPVLQQFRSAYPDTYKSILTLVQSVVALGRQLETTDQDLAKKEKSTKVWQVEDPSGWGQDKLRIPSEGHANRPAWDESIKQNVAAHYTRGDTSGLRYAMVPVDKVSGGNSAGVVNKERYRMYRRMFSAGDMPHPIVVTPNGNGYRLADGTHRHQAAVDEGLTHVPAYIYGEGLKKAISEIPAGRHVGTATASDDPEQIDAFDYNHVLSPEHRAAGLSLNVAQHRNTRTGRIESIRAHLKQAKNASFPESSRWATPKEVGHVHSYVEYPSDSKLGDDGPPGSYENYAFHGKPGDIGSSGAGAGPPTLEPHSELWETHQGKGLGQKMYEAVYAHAKHVAGVSHVKGGIHSEDAHKLHQRLAAKHGFEYNGTTRGRKGDFMYPYGGYNYTLKTEPEQALPDSEIIGPGKGVTFLRQELQPDQQVPEGSTLDKGAPDPTHPHRHLVLPVGTLNHGELKVQHGDGKTSWKGVRAGLIQGQEPGVPQQGANSHPVSSREPGSR